MTRTVKIVILVVLAVAAAAAIAGIVGMAVASHSGVVYGPRQMMGNNAFPGMGGGQVYRFGAHGANGGWGAFRVLPWFSLALVIGLAAVLLLWRPLQATPATATAGGTGAAAGTTPTAGTTADTAAQWAQ